MIFSSSVLLDIDPWPVPDPCVMLPVSFFGTRVAHRPLPGISPRTSAEKHPIHPERGFHAHRRQQWVSASSHPRARRSAPCPIESRSRAGRLLENLANHPMKIRQTLPVSEQVYPQTDYIRIDIIWIEDWVVSCATVPLSGLSAGITFWGNSRSVDSITQ